MCARRRHGCGLGVCCGYGRAEYLPWCFALSPGRARRSALQLLQRGANLGKVGVRIVDAGHNLPSWRATALHLDAPSVERELLQTEASSGRGQGGVLGALVRLDVDGESKTAMLELHDAERFNTLSGSAAQTALRQVGP